MHAAGGAAEALVLLAAHPFIAGAVLEIELVGSEVDGYAIAAAARAQRPDLAIVFLTGRSDLLVGRVLAAREAHLVNWLDVCPGC